MNASTDSTGRNAARPRHAGADAIDGLLDAQLARIRRRFLLHGLGWVVAAIAAATVVYFGLDLGLQLPRAVRIVVSLGVLAYLAAGVRRRVLYPLRRSFGREDVAIAFERRFPELHERLISAYQLEVAAGRGADRREQSDAMIARVVADAAESIRRLPTQELLDPRRTARVWAAAGVALAVGLGAAALQPTEFGVFAQRALGLDVGYPRRTSLYVELPEDEPGILVERSEGRADVTLAAGGDLPVLVRAEGVTPREAQLVIRGGRGLPSAVTMAQRPGERFRHVFRRVQAPFAFHARGGDDPSGDLEVFVRTVEPPLVGTIEAELTFPAYTGLPPARVVGGAVEALVGTTVELTVTTTTPVDRAGLRFLDGGGELELKPLQVEDDSGAGRAFGGSFVVAQTDRYEVQLENRDGLGNPRPGAYPVLALEDHTPTGKVLLPASDDVTVVLPTALLPVRIEARDDFGLSAVQLEATTGRAGAAESLALLEPPADPLRETVLTELLDVAALEPGDGPRQGDTISLVVRLEDNKEPEHGATEFPRRQVHVVDAIELARRVSTHFRRIRDQVDKALAQQAAQLDAADALLEDVPATGGARDPRLVQLQVGQISVHGVCRRARGDLMRAYDLHLFNGLEGEDSVNVPKVRALYLRVLREDRTPDALLPAFYRAVAAAQQAGEVGPMEKALDPILAMTMRADRLVEELGAKVNDILDAAGIAASGAELLAALSEARAIQATMVAELEALLAQLQEWNEYQDVVQSVRALRDAQRDVEFRTRAIHGR